MYQPWDYETGAEWNEWHELWNGKDRMEGTAKYHCFRKIHYIAKKQLIKTLWIPNNNFAITIRLLHQYNILTERVKINK